MPPISAPTIRQLALIKYMFQEGEQQSRRPSPLFVTALLSFQDAAELFLHLACEHNQIVLKKQTQFLEYFSALAPVGNVLHQPGMDRLNRARVNFKHHGNLPNDGDMEFFRVTARSFFEENSPLLFGLAFAEISLVDLVACEKARDLLRQAQQALGAGERRAAETALALAFKALLADYRGRKRVGRTQDDLFSLGPSMSFMSSFHLGVKDREIARFVDSTREAIERLRDVVEILSYGLDYRKYARFNLLTPFIQFTVSGDHVVIARPGSDLTDDEYDYCFSFVIESAVKLQEFDFTVT
ncbi:MAG: hypothetical protein WB493_01625 [Anaeromyxobacteraceae bacterium]